MKIKLSELKKLIREAMSQEDWDGEEEEVETTRRGTSVDDFFSWYEGPGWNKEWQITNSMVVDGEHAQDHARGVTYWLDFLAQNSATPINITSTITAFDTWDNVFEIDGHRFSVDSLEPFGRNQ